jgi:septal ring factor EnvC (AmiA/AmiB activator)
MSSANKKDYKHWYEEPIKRGFAIFSGFIFIASIGYSLAIVQKNVEFKLEKYELKQDYNKQLQDQLNKCNEEKASLENKRIEAIEKVVTVLQKNYDGKK